MMNKIIFAHYHIYCSQKSFCELEPYINKFNKEAEYVEYILIPCFFLEGDTIYVSTKSIEEMKIEAIKNLKNTSFLKKRFNMKNRYDFHKNYLNEKNIKKP